MFGFFVWEFEITYPKKSISIFHAQKNPQKLKCFFLDREKAIRPKTNKPNQYRSQSKTKHISFKPHISFKSQVFHKFLSFHKSTIMSSVSRTVSNTAFTFTPVKQKEERGDLVRGRGTYRPRPRPHTYRRREQEALKQAVKEEHAAAAAAADDGEWVVKGKKHNKLVHVPTPEEQAELARLQQERELVSIQQTLSNSMSGIRPLKRKKVEKAEKKDKAEKKKPALSNSFALLAVDSTDDEQDEPVVAPIKDDDFPTIAASAPTTFSAPTVMSYSKALQKQQQHVKRIGPEDFPDPPTHPVFFKSIIQDQEDEDEDEEEDYKPFKRGQAWTDFM